MVKHLENLKKQRENVKKAKSSLTILFVALFIITITK